MNKDKKMCRSLFLLGIIFISILSISMVSAVMSGVFVSPTVATRLSGNVLFNVSVNANVGVNFTCTISAKSASTANSSWSTIVVIGTQNSSATNWNKTASTIVIQDSNDYILNLTCTNGTDTVSNTTSGFTVDNTIPSAPTLSPASNTIISSSSDPYTFTGTVIDANTTSCTYTIYRGGGSSDGSSGTASYSGSSCTFTKSFTSSNDNGDWYWTVTASDGTNSTSSSSNIFSVAIPGTGGGSLPPSTTGSGTTATTISNNTIYWIIGIIIVILVLWWVFKK